LEIVVALRGFVDRLSNVRDVRQVLDADIAGEIYSPAFAAGKAIGGGTCGEGVLSFGWAPCVLSSGSWYNRAFWPSVSAAFDDLARFLATSAAWGDRLGFAATAVHLFRSASACCTLSCRLGSLSADLLFCPFELGFDV
jgi:hypothetical protein